MEGINPKKIKEVITMTIKELAGDIASQNNSFFKLNDIEQIIDELEAATNLKRMELHLRYHIGANEQEYKSWSKKNGGEYIKQNHKIVFSSRRPYYTEDEIDRMEALCVKDYDD